MTAGTTAGERTSLAFRTTDGPVGPLLLAATEQGLLRLAFVGEDHDAVRQKVADVVRPAGEGPAAWLDPAVRQLEGYFEGSRQAFDLSLDLRLTRGFRRTVLTRLAGVGYGRTVSYAALAALAGSPGAVRAVGTACATNPLPVVIPCHRVVRSDGSLGGYLGGLDAKRTLLALEAA